VCKSRQRGVFQLPTRLSHLQETDRKNRSHTCPLRPGKLQAPDNELGRDQNDQVGDDVDGRGRELDSPRVQTCPFHGRVPDQGAGCALQSLDYGSGDIIGHIERYYGRAEPPEGVVVSWREYTHPLH